MWSNRNTLALLDCPHDIGKTARRGNAVPFSCETLFEFEIIIEETLQNVYFRIFRENRQYMNSTKATRSAYF